jgi:hypothetical protein
VFVTQQKQASAGCPGYRNTSWRSAAVCSLHSAVRHNRSMLFRHLNPLPSSGEWHLLSWVSTGLTKTSVTPLSAFLLQQELFIVFFRHRQRALGPRHVAAPPPPALGAHGGRHTSPDMTRATEQVSSAAARATVQQWDQTSSRLTPRAS